MSLVKLSGPSIGQEVSARQVPLLAKGFRPFFLLAALLAALWVPLWLGLLTRRLAAGPYLAAPEWHAHEMVFGYAVAVISGFLLTAASNWTGRETATGVLLAALAGLWLLGRVAFLAGQWLPAAVTAVVDLSFLPALGAAVARPLWIARNRRNYGFVALIALLFIANLTVHLSALGLMPGFALRGSSLGLDFVVLVILVVSGRVIPMFTRNATGAAVKSSVTIDRLALGAMLALTALDVTAPWSTATGWAALLAALLSALRAARWGARHATDPMLWVLHAGYSWVPIGLGLRAASLLGESVPATAGVHALTIGAIGMLTLGMMARVALGHTGRAITASRPLCFAFFLVGAAAVVRVAGAIFGSAFYLATLYASGSLWTIAFIIYLGEFLPVLFTPRADGRPG